MPLSTRLQAIVSLVPSDAHYIADIGADHGLVCLELLKREDVKIFASDNKLGPFTKLKATLNGYKNVKVSFSDGLEDLDNDVDTLIISGMGGDTIINILGEHQEHLKHLKYIILSPHNAHYEVRKAMNKYGFKIQEEKMIFSQNKYYSLMLYKLGKENLSELDYKYGPLNLKNKDDVFIDYINELIAKNELLLHKNLSSERKYEIEMELKELKNL